MRLINNSKLTSYEELLERDESVSVYHRNIQNLDTDMFHIKYGQSPDIVTDFLHRNHDRTISDKIKILGHPF